MGNEEFLKLCKEKVAEYTNQHMDKTDQKQITPMMYTWCGHVKRCRITKPCLAPPCQMECIMS